MGAVADPVADAFRRLLDALLRQDVEAYRSLAVRDAPEQDALFLANARRLCERGHTLRLRRVIQEEDAADVSFDVVDGHAQVVGSGQVTFTREADGWRVRAL